MIYFDHLPLEKDILEALAELTINYVFQPIFYPDGKTVYAYEALMRPTNMSVTELIAEYEKKDKLHVLEVATFFGATQEFVLRGYTEYLSMNSFPSEAFTVGEGNVYKDYYGDILKKNIDPRGTVLAGAPTRTVPFLLAPFRARHPIGRSTS